MGILLDVRDLHTSFFIEAGEVEAVRGLTFHVNEGEIVALVGESGCGKSVTAMSIMRLVPSPGKVTRGEIIFDGRDLLELSEREMEQVRGNEIGMVFQDPMTSLNPVLNVRTQIVEAILAHNDVSSREAEERAIELLKLVQIPSPERRLKSFPHELSGGMRQRVLIAMTLACNPKLVIADEPTTALDVTIQAQIIDLLLELNKKLGMSIMLITHDLGVVAGMAMRVAVMYAGRLVELGNSRDIYYHAQHPYTKGLLKSVPRLDADEKRKLAVIDGQPPDLLDPPPGCAFAPRCELAMDICTQKMPELTDVSSGHQAACWLKERRVREDIRVGTGGDS
ncbi:MAG: ABC transporter ATP-binding protein [Firmicutes bacterium]|nr:ABC transporter ATP-binding protein [Bacillota bacterium]